MLHWSDDKVRRHCTVEPHLCNLAHVGSPSFNDVGCAVPKLLITMKRRSGLSREEFIEYYNERHLTNVSRILPATGAGRRVHIRNFVDPEHPLVALIGDGRAAPGEPLFDCVTEIIFENDALAAEFFRSFFAPQAIAQIRDDEAQFIDLDSIRFYMVDTIEVVRGE